MEQVVKRAIVTGASKGIGAATARRFRAAGWEVLSLARGGCPVDGVVSARVDLLAQGWEAAARAAIDAFLGDDAGVVCLVHNAALLEKDTALDLSPEALRRVLEVNVVAPAALNRMVRAKLSRGSSIVYVGSTLSEKAVANAASYATSKHALLGLMRATCQDLLGTGAHTACVCPGFTDTEMLRAHVPSPDVRAALGARTTIGRLVEPDEIADVILFCAEHPVVNGAVLHANLGQIET